MTEGGYDPADPQGVPNPRYMQPISETMRQDQVMTNTHTHARTDELTVFWVPANTDIPMELKIIENNREAMSRLVGGFIERIHTRVMPELPCGCGMDMIANEEGLLRGLPQNLRASVYKPGYLGIVGDVFFIGEGLVHIGDPDESPEPDWFSLPPSYRAWEGPGSPPPTSALAPWEQ